ncbi:MAG: zinc ribbon domain-containing protein [Armatimonadota bacterium]|nr:zinc ribbon domain-containing protein [bacterium]MCS7308627.1 zinc ribbon domain-containing protein [Armatimonadota bacterium]MDW8103951.1 zinc ribbon domain-containing protein [Armatimonadota bacterium]MDW8289941.1 zinc ribbon domain-containing protein [Armatimonadota bacterium]
MPIYEFRCKGCGQKFEQRFSSTEVSGVTCPQCGSAEVSRLLSLFFVPKVSQDMGVVGCDRCAGNPPSFREPGGCSLCET